MPAYTNRHRNPELRQPGRVLTPGTVAIYLRRTLPTVYIELQQLGIDERNQMLVEIRNETQRWMSMSNKAIESKLRNS
jgi:hypothetical protein